MIDYVAEFHKKFGLPTGTKDILSNDTDTQTFRLQFLQEELDELKVALGEESRTDAFDALLDIVYVAYGTALYLGISPGMWRLGMSVVHSCNMAKVRAENPTQSKRGTILDVVKPANWVGPEIKLGEILRSRLESTPSADLSSVSSKDLLSELSSRGGHPGALADAALLCLKKSEDYNGTEESQDPHKVDRSPYFPFGDVSYAQMLHTKAQRFNSLIINGMRGKSVNFEGLVDTALDIINYAGFFIASKKKG